MRSSLMLRPFLPEPTSKIVPDKALYPNRWWQRD